MTENGKAKVYRALELQVEISNINRKIKKLESEKKLLAAELTPIMDDPYIYDKVEGLKMGGIL